jgi:hypothetical protein
VGNSKIYTWMLVFLVDKVALEDIIYDTEDDEKVPE